MLFLEKTNKKESDEKYAILGKKYMLLLNCIEIIAVNEAFAFNP